MPATQSSTGGAVMRKQRHVALVGAAVAIALFVTGCGSNGGDASDQKIKPAGQAAADGIGGAESGPAGKTGAAGALEVKQDAKLGEIVTDAKGWTLYRSDDDTAKPSQSNCSGDCEKS